MGKKIIEYTDIELVETSAVGIPAYADAHKSVEFNTIEKKHNKEEVSKMTEKDVIKDAPAKEDTPQQDAVQKDNSEDLKKQLEELKKAQETMLKEKEDLRKQVEELQKAKDKEMEVMVEKMIEQKLEKSQPEPQGLAKDGKMTDDHSLLEKQMIEITKSQVTHEEKINRKIDIVGEEFGKWLHAEFGGR